MPLHLFPIEILHEIISNLLPEGFDAATLTCKKIYDSCVPFRKRHIDLQVNYTLFNYRGSPEKPSPSKSAFPLKSASHLITRIAIEPDVARYITHPDFRLDSCDLVNYSPSFQDLDRREVVDLFANSQYRKQAGLDWKEFFHQIKEDVKNARYSQYAAVFLLTLLPNVLRLQLPAKWKPLNSTEKILEAVVQKAKQSHLTCNKSSLSWVWEIISASPASVCFDVSWASPFLVLPHVQSFRGHHCVVTRDDHQDTVSQIFPHAFAETLETVHFLYSWIDEKGITDFLRQTSHLKHLQYYHAREYSTDRPSWGPSTFVAAVEREAGNHLERLSLDSSHYLTAIASGKVSISGFARLQRLEFSLNCAMCYRSVAESSPEVGGISIGDCVPSSVSVLSLLSLGTADDGEMLDLLFRDFVVKKNLQLPALKLLYLSYPADADLAYKNHCSSLLVQTEEVDVSLRLRRCLYSKVAIGNRDQCLCAPPSSCEQ